MKKSILTALLILPILGQMQLSLAASEPSDELPAASEEWRKEPPKAPAPRAFKMPTITRYKLANGLSVELVEDHRVPFTTVCLGIKVGTAHDPADFRGVAALTADMLVEGSGSKSSKQIAEEIDFIGGAFAAGAGADFTTISASALSQYNKKLFNIFQTVLLTPSFPEAELKLKKTNLIQELNMKRSKPDFLVEEKFADVVFGEHPYAFISPKPQAVEKISKEQLQNFHSKFYLPNESVLIVVGDFKAEEMKSLISQSFDGWKSGSLLAANITPAPKQAQRKIYLVDRPGSVQSSLKIGNLGIKRSDPDYFAMVVANQVLGGAAVSRLFTNIRENKGYTYGAYSEATARRYPGSVSASAEVRTDVTAPALQEFLYEMERIRNVKASDKEMDSAKNCLVGGFQLGLETQNGLAQRLLEGALYDLPDNYLESYSEKIMAINADDVRRVARRNLNLDNIVVTVVGDASKIKGDLEYFAPVAVFDTSGSLVKTEAKLKQPGS